MQWDSKRLVVREQYVIQVFSLSQNMLPVMLVKFRQSETYESLTKYIEKYQHLHVKSILLDLS